MVVEFFVKKMVILNSGRNNLYVKVPYLLIWKIRNTLTYTILVGVKMAFDLPRLNDKITCRMKTSLMVADDNFELRTSSTTNPDP